MSNESKCALVRKGIVRGKGKPSVEWWKDGNPMRYCYGYTDKMTDKLLVECQYCKHHVSKAQDDLDAYLKSNATG